MEAISKSTTMSEIYPNLYLGNVTASRNEPFIRKSKITHILIAAKNLKQHFKTKCTYMQLPLADIPVANIMKHFVESIQFIDEALASGKNVLVHCLGGISRSATIVIAYVMLKERKSFSEAFEFVQKKRSKVRPNPGFVSQLELFGKCLKTYFENTKSDKIDFPFLLECITPFLTAFEKKRLEE